MKTLSGIIVSTVSPKTAVVEVILQKKNSLYGKIIFRAKRFLVHAEGVKVGKGDTVTIGETRPISKNKHFKIIKIIKSSK